MNRKAWPFRISTVGNEGLAYLRGHPNLKRLNPYCNEKVTDADVAHVAELKSMRQLVIGLTRIGDVGPEHLHPLANLERRELPNDISRPAAAALLATKPRMRNLSCGNSSNRTYGDQVLERVGPSKLRRIRHGGIAPRAAASSLADESSATIKRNDPPGRTPPRPPVWETKWAARGAVRSG